MKKHTTLNLDYELVREAQEILGTKQTTETVHRALREVIDRKNRQAVFDYTFPDLTPEALEEIRAPRSFGPDRSEE